MIQASPTLSKVKGGRKGVADARSGHGTSSLMKARTSSPSIQCSRSP
jgi:hypothetical protein